MDKQNTPRFPLPKLRLLPIFILAGALMFGARVGSLWQQGASPDAGARGTIDTQAFIPAAMAESPEPAPAQAEKGLGGEEMITQSSGAAAGQGGNGPYSQTEIQVLQQLAERRESIERRERELDQRLAVLSAAESQIDAKIQKLREIQTTIESLLEKHDEQEAKKIDNLVKIYQSMKPKDAARIFDQMEMPILVKVVGAMKERTSAAILSKMTPERANAVTAELATQTRLPEGLTANSGG